MPLLSAVLITRNEAGRLEEALDSVSFADEIVVLDSGSQDGTPSLARARGARVVEAPWEGYIAQKNRALREARHPWVLAIDADERVSPALAASVRAELSGEPAFDGYSVCRLGHWEGAAIRHGTWYPDRRVRLVRRDRARWTGQEPHDRLEVSGRVGRLAGDLLHHPYRDLGEHLATIDRYTAIAARAMHAEGRRARAWDLLIRPPAHLFKALVLRAGFLDGVRGLDLAALGALYVLLKWSRLARLQQAGP